MAIKRLRNVLRRPKYIATKAKVHLTTSFIDSFKHDEIGVGHKINIRGWRFIFSSLLVCAAGVCFAKSRDSEN